MGGGVFAIVEDALREAAETAILPRFRALAEADISEKSPGEIVTVADGEAERLIAARLSRLVPGARIVGEEACAQDPRLLRGLDEGAVWVIDPLDGTANFAAGRAPFAVMAALLRDGAPVAAFIYDPLNRKMCAAELGGGAHEDGARVRVSADAPDSASLCGAVLNRKMPPDMRARVAACFAGRALVPGLSCAGAEYPAVATGDRHFAVFWRTLPWDHAPGALFLSEAGGHVARWDGAPYRAGDDETGLIVARTSSVADSIIGLLAE